MDYRKFKKALFSEELSRELDIDPDTATMKDVNHMMAKISKYQLDILEGWNIPHEQAMLLTELSIYMAGLYYDLRKRVEDREN